MEKSNMFMPNVYASWYAILSRELDYQMYRIKRIYETSGVFIEPIVKHSEFCIHEKKLRELLLNFYSNPSISEEEVERMVTDFASSITSVQEQIDEVIKEKKLDVPKSVDIYRKE